MSKAFSFVLVAAVGLFGFAACMAESDTGSSSDPVSVHSSDLVNCDEAVVGKKITICHHTGSATNPYVGITIAVKGCIAGHQAQHPEDLNPSADGTCPTCVADGHACLEDGACCGGSCIDGICQPPSCEAPGAACTADAECCSLSCCPDTNTCF